LSKGSFEHYIRSGQKLLRCGYTTGTCAALAAAGATRLLLSGSAPETVCLQTPKGLEVTVPLEEALLLEGGRRARCAVVKDGGDDCDVTHGLRIRVTVGKSAAPGVTIDGGEGVGRVTRPGLDQAVGQAAINRVPRRMIREQVQAVCDELGYDGGLEVIVSVPDGARAAERTFNPVLGVEGGISILGTSGIVEPMSEQAIVDTIAVEQRQAAATGARGLILTPGNYGEDFLRANGLDRKGFPVVKCSNFLGDALDIAATQGFTQVLLIGHIGKLVKVAGGIMNTHSRYADCRTELFCAHAALCGADRTLCRGLMACATSDACIALLDAHDLRQPVLDSLLAAIQLHLDRRGAGAYAVGAILFSNEYGLLGRTQGAKEIMDTWK
jgi:cobalt-precorrin-5B (C1)-methyltransferase